MRVALAAGGTAGHIFPALATLGALRATGEPVEARFFGPDNRGERALVQGHDVPFETVPAAPLRGRSPVALARGLARTAFGIAAALRSLRRFRPNVLLSTGGYGSFPPSVAARLLRPPPGRVPPGRGARPGGARREPPGDADRGGHGGGASAPSRREDGRERLPRARRLPHATRASPGGTRLGCGRTGTAGCSGNAGGTAHQPRDLAGAAGALRGGAGRTRNGRGGLGGGGQRMGLAARGTARALRAGAVPGGPAGADGRGRPGGDAGGREHAGGAASGGAARAPRAGGGRRRAPARARDDEGRGGMAEAARSAGHPDGAVRLAAILREVAAQ